MPSGVVSSLIDAVAFMEDNDAELGFRAERGMDLDREGLVFGAVLPAVANSSLPSARGRSIAGGSATICVERGDIETRAHRVEPRHRSQAAKLGALCPQASVLISLGPARDGALRRPSGRRCGVDELHKIRFAIGDAPVNDHVAGIVEHHRLVELLADIESDPDLDLCWCRHVVAFELLGPASWTGRMTDRRSARRTCRHPPYE